MFLPNVPASRDIVEHVVGDLEREAEIQPVARERLLVFGGSRRAPRRAASPAANNTAVLRSMTSR